MDIEMFGQLLPEQANAPDSATTYGFAGPVTGTLPPLLSHQLIPNLGHVRSSGPGGPGRLPAWGSHRPSLKESVVSRAFWRIFGRGIFCTPDFGGASCLKPSQYIVDFRCPEKRSPALRGRNRTRDIRADGAPMVHLAPGDQESLGAIFFPTPLDTGVMPRKSRGEAASWTTTETLTLPHIADSGPCHVPLVRSCHGLFSRGFLQPIFSLRLAVPLEALVFRPHAAERCRVAGLLELVTRYLQPGRCQWKRQDLLRSWGTPIVLLPCSSTPVGPTHQALAMRRRGPRCVHDEGSRTGTFEAQSHDFGTGCLRFAGRVAPTPRKTRFRLLAKLFRTGLITRRVPSKGFKVYPSWAAPLCSMIASLSGVVYWS
jgi:hypothetical protein